MEYRYSVSCSETLNKIWTQQAQDCYLIGCNCSKCFLYKVFFSRRNYECKMKYTVIELVKRIGVPSIKKNDV